MCIAINSKKGTSPTKDQLKESFDSNPHGGGYCFADGEKVVIKKGFFTFDDFYRSYQNDNMSSKDKLIHFRIATHGAINADNCHPFKITEQVSMIHNGVIDHFGSPSLSDTKEFAELILQPLIINGGFDVLKKQSVANMLSDAIGNSKLVFLNHKGHTVIINEKKGHWSKGVWFSNNSYKKESYYGTNNAFNFNSNHYKGFGYKTSQSECYECFQTLAPNDNDGLCFECENEHINGYGYPKEYFTTNKGDA